MKRTKVLGVAWKAKHLWQLLSLLSRDFGDVTLGEIVAEGGRKGGGTDG
jgi:hypothetical protein